MSEILILVFFYGFLDPLNILFILTFLRIIRGSKSNCNLYLSVLLSCYPHSFYFSF